MSERAYPKKTAITHTKMRIRGEPYVEGEWKSPELTFDIFAGHPQIVVWSEHPSELNKVDHRGKPLHNVPIKASTSINYLRAMLEHMLILLDANEPSTHILHTLTIPRDPNTNETIKGKKVPQAKIVYGRNPEGYLFIEIRNKDRPVLPFLFKNDGWHEFEGDFPVDNTAATSTWIARGHIKNLIDIYVNVFSDSFDPDFKTQAQIKAAALAESTKNTPSNAWS